MAGTVEVGEGELGLLGAGLKGGNGFVVLLELEQRAGIQKMAGKVLFAKAGELDKIVSGIFKSLLVDRDQAGKSVALADLGTALGRTS